MFDDTFLDNLFSKMTIVIDRDQYKHTVFFLCNGIVHMGYNLKNENLWYGDKIWSFLVVKNEYDNIKTKALIKHKMEQYFRLKVRNLNHAVKGFDFYVGNHFSKHRFNARIRLSGNNTLNQIYE